MDVMNPFSSRVYYDKHFRRCKNKLAFSIKSEMVLVHMWHLLRLHRLPHLLENEIEHGGHKKLDAQVHK